MIIILKKTLATRCLVLFLALLVGCSTPELHDPQISGELHNRTGHSIGSQLEPGNFALPPGISINQPLNDDDVVAIALWNNALFQELLSELGLAEADLIKAGEIVNPTFMALFPIGPKQLEFSAKFPFEALWLRSDRIEVADFAVQQIAEQMVQGGLNLIRDVKVACINLRLASSVADIRKDAATLLEAMSELARSRLNAGDISEIEAINVRVESLNAAQAWKQAEADVEIAKAQLQNLMGLGNAPMVFRLAESTASIPVDRKIEGLIEDALANRPDLRAAELSLEAAGKQIGLAESEIYQLTFIIDANYDDDTDHFEMGPGVEFSIPIMNQNQGNKAVTSAKWDQALRRYISLSHQIILDVRQAFAQWNQAVATVDAWEEELIPELQSATRLAQNGVRSGDLDPLLPLQTEHQLITAMLKFRAALADQQRAVAELERSIGHRLDLNPSRPETLTQEKP